jgi:excisionase family DNA binding protein
MTASPPSSLCVAAPVDADHMNVITPVQSKLYTLNEVADLVGMHYETVRRLMFAGEFPVPAFKMAGRWFVRRAQLDAFLQGI